MDITICAWDILLVKQGHGARRSFPYSMTISKVIIAIYRSGFKCKKCNKTYSSKNIYVDLTVTAGTKEFNEFKPARTELFRSLLVSFLYERGWRQNFNRSSFLGPDEEVGGGDHVDGFKTLILLDFQNQLKKLLSRLLLCNCNFDFIVLCFSDIYYCIKV
ncbi:uncharacterized methyltransferase At1g78140, chloroplastic-like isoform X1 [Ipomoea triloba]|uniref:uncharacterized methyltransferase At1g78140, chloroplastic-like isoform X1 n=1 Tax=Ipomoea triloba TaxID=35885 RepID=UPI00125E846E|nr:uncharacterized methyltransferase At1g78140, chloroplastic-like isoform X1 [Ipomoea triloba]XP_031111559.1 uncharacterized methyltransferase At1g78140, chloroplastic-like isoform X1 [Ipomoea triloba]